MKSTSDSPGATLGQALPPPSQHKIDAIVKNDYDEGPQTDQAMQVSLTAGQS